jgi:lipoprotein-releasing system ATP-binding protein
MKERDFDLGFAKKLRQLYADVTGSRAVPDPDRVIPDDETADLVFAAAVELLAEVGLAQAARRRVGELSGGEQQRVALARALANQPAVLLADEPTGNLDQRTAGRVIEVLEGLHRAHGLTSVLATHNLELAQRAHRTLRLSDGTLTETVVPEVH